MIDEGYFPMAFLFITVIIFLSIALYFNFIHRELVYEEDILKRLKYDPHDGRVFNTKIESIDPETGNIKLLNYKNLVSK